MSQLNPALYEALKSEFGRVKIANQGQQFVGQHYKLDDVTRLRAISSGEYYCVACPFCTDTQTRLWINHRWGVRDSVTGTRNRWLAICFKDDCLRNADNREQLIEMLTWYNRSAGAGDVSIRKGTIAIVAKSVPLPKDFVPLTDLPTNHPACEYLRGRGFDPKRMSKRWGVGYSARDSFPSSSRGRLVIPIKKLESGQPVHFGWQSRQIVDDPSAAKYCTARGFKKSQALYGIEWVDGSTEPVLIMEGPTDVWRAKKNAVAIWGKTASESQKALILQHLRDRPLVIVLDQDALADAKKLRTELRDRRKSEKQWHSKLPVVVARLEKGRDPADYDRTQLLALADEALARRSKTRSQK